MLPVFCSSSVMHGAHPASFSFLNQKWSLFGSPPDARLGQHVPAAMHQRPIGGDVEVGWIVPIGVVDEEDAAGFEFGKRGAGTDGPIPAIDDDEIERGIILGKNGGGIARQRSVIAAVGVCFGVVERDVAEIDVVNACLREALRDGGEPGGIAFNADESAKASSKPEGAATAAPLPSTHVWTQMLLQPGDRAGGEPGMIGMAFLIKPVLQTACEIEGTEEIAQPHVAVAW